MHTVRTPHRTARLQHTPAMCRYAFDQSLRLEVVGPMPLLQAAIEGMPTSLLLGQVAPAQLHRIVHRIVHRTLHRTALLAAGRAR
jgi:hypothetical protein